MSSPSDRLAASRLRTAFDLAAAGFAMKRAQIRRKHPELDDAAVERALDQWARGRVEHLELSEWFQVRRWPRD